MTDKEFQIYNEAVRQKYKHFRLWRILAIVFMCLTVLFATLFFANGDVFRQTTNINNTNDVEILNEGSNNNNNNNVVINN